VCRTRKKGRGRGRRGGVRRGGAGRRKRRALDEDPTVDATDEDVDEDADAKIGAEQAGARQRERGNRTRAIRVVE